MNGPLRAPFLLVLPLLACAGPATSRPPAPAAPPARVEPLVCPGTEPDPAVDPASIPGPDRRLTLHREDGKRQPCMAAKAAALPPFPHPVTIKFLVLPDGRPTRFQVMTPDLPDTIACAVRAALRECRFEPARDADGVAWSTWFLMPIKLAEGAPGR